MFRRGKREDAMNMQKDILSRSGMVDAPISERLATFALDLTHDAIPAKLRTRAVHHMLDAAGIAVASTRYDFAHRTMAGLQVFSTGGKVPVLGMPTKMNPRNAATMNGTLIHGLDFDDTHIAGIIHPTASILPAVLSAASMAGASGRDLLTAYVVGVETATRIGACAKSAFHQVGFHPTGMVGIFGCVLAAGRLLGLNAAQLVNAQGLAVSMASGAMEFVEDGAWNKRIHPGWAAASALTAVVLAREGFIGATKPYDGRYGLFNIFGGKYTDWIDLTNITTGLGITWELYDTAIKPFPTCHFTHAAIDCALKLRDRCPVDEIDKIEIRVPEEVFQVICEPVANKLRPKNDYDAKFSVQFLVASALVHGQLGLAELEPACLINPDTLALADLCSHSAFGEGPFPKAYSGAVTIRLKDGSLHEHSEPVNRGAADRPLSNADIIDKYRANAALWAGPAKVARMEESLLGLAETPVAVDAFKPFCGA